jgi:non-heme chloroperoxidase
MAEVAASATERESHQIEEANASGRTPVVFVHGLWLLPSSWERWSEHVHEAGYAPVEATWPGDAATVAEARADTDSLAGKTVAEIVGHLAATIGRLSAKPALVGHSFGGMFVQMLAGRGIACATVSISPAPYRGVLSLPRSALKSGSPVLRNPLNHGRTVMLTEGQFRYAFANAVGEEDARGLYADFAVPAPGAPLFQSAAANLNPFTQVKVDTHRPDRGPMLVVCGGKDHTIPPAIAKATYRLQQKNAGITEYAEIADRGHALTIDNGWRDVADTALAFVQRFA